MPNATDLAEQFGRFSETWTPHLVGELNGQQVKLVKLEGDKCPWHFHAAEDELFLVVAGTLDIHLRGAVVTVGPGEFFIVRQGVEHRPVPRGAVRAMLFEPASTAHTGNVLSEITRAESRRLDPA
jgi:mannose-6-phosphate isomerase-like protein (cupin superfamily)